MSTWHGHPSGPVPFTRHECLQATGRCLFKLRLPALHYCPSELAFVLDLFSASRPEFNFHNLFFAILLRQIAGCQVYLKQAAHLDQGTTFALSPGHPVDAAEFDDESNRGWRGMQMLDFIGGILGAIVEGLIVAPFEWILSTIPAWVWLALIVILGVTVTLSLWLAK